ncbi:MAG: hypothetical protein KJO69_10425, partial [Gammaproteobacteria bacterium]|nr:hypothetical protein [Gammaproteobacteria bacterium]
IAGAFAYVNALQNTVEELTTENTELKVSNESLKAERERTLEQLSASKTNLRVVNTKFKKAQEQKKEIIRIFGDHDFEKLLKAKPEWMGKKMTEGTRKVFREIERESN